MFSVGACLWYCADYGLSENEEPVLSKKLQNLLVDMTRSAVQERPTLQQLVQVSKYFTVPYFSVRKFYCCVVPKLLSCFRSKYFLFSIFTIQIVADKLIRHIIAIVYI